MPHDNLSPEELALAQDLYNAVARADVSKVEQILKNKINKDTPMVGEVSGPSSLALAPSPLAYYYHPDGQKTCIHIALTNLISAPNDYIKKSIRGIVELLLQAGARVDAKDGQNYYTALHILADQNGPNERALIRSIIRHNGSINLANGYGNTPLHIACRNGNVENANILLTFGANVNIVNNHGSTPLHMLCYSSSTPTRPLSARSNINFVGGNLPQEIESIIQQDEDSIFYSKYPKDNSNSHIDLLNRLIDLGADVNSVDNKGLSPLLVCCSTDRLDLIKVLVKNGADVNCRDKEKRTAIDIAHFYRHAEIVDYFQALSRK